MSANLHEIAALLRDYPDGDKFLEEQALIERAARSLELRGGPVNLYESITQVSVQAIISALTYNDHDPKLAAGLSSGLIDHYNTKLGGRLDDAVKIENLVLPPALRTSVPDLQINFRRVGLYNRALLNLKPSGIDTVGKLREQTREDLGFIRNIGPNAATFLHQAFQASPQTLRNR